MSKKAKECLTIVITIILGCIALYFTWIYRDVEIVKTIWTVITYAWIAFMTVLDLIGLIYICKFCKSKKNQ